MDRRGIQTRRAIHDAFLELAQEKPVRKITVTELARRAQINKSTFYRHYETIYDLIDEMEQEAVDLVIEQMHSTGTLREDPAAFVHGLAGALSSSSLILYPGVYSPESEKAFHDRLFNAIAQMARTEHLDPALHEKEGAVLAFIIHGLLGAQHLLPKLMERNVDVIADLVSDGVHSLWEGS